MAAGIFLFVYERKSKNIPSHKKAWKGFTVFHKTLLNPIKPYKTLLNPIKRYIKHYKTLLNIILNPTDIKRETPRGLRDCISIVYNCISLYITLKFHFKPFSLYQSEKLFENENHVFWTMEKNYFLCRESQRDKVERSFPTLLEKSNQDSMEKKNVQTFFFSWTKYVTRKNLISPSGRIPTCFQNN